MASSFIEDILGSEVDEKAVSAVVGSLESQLATPSGNKAASVGPAKTLPRLQRSSQVPLPSSSVESNATQSNNSTVGNNTSNSAASPVNSGKSSYHTNSSSGSVSTPINIAPRPIVTTTVSLAPRTVTLLSSQTGNRGTSYLPVQAGELRLPVSSLMLGPGGTRLPMTPGLVRSQMSQLPRPGSAQTLLHGSRPTQSGNNTPQTGSVAQRVIKQEPHALTRPQVTLLKNSMHARPQTSGVHIGKQSHTNLLLKNNSPLQGNVVNHASSSMITKTVTAAVATTTASSSATQVNINSSAVTQAQLKHAEKLKQVSKLQGFFTKLIDLASAQSPAIGNSVRELIKAVMERKLTEEDFTAKLEKTLHSPSQPNLVNFLKQTLPFLQSAQKVNAAVSSMQQARHVQKPVQSVAATTKAQPTILPSTQVTQQVPQVIPKPQMKPVATAQQIVITPQTLAQFTPQQQQQLLAQHPRLQQLFPKMQLATSKSGVVLLPTQAADRQGAAVSGSIKPTPAPSASAQAQDKSKARPTSSISAVTSGNDDDINDVACMAGVNLQEEQSKILATNSEILNLQLRSCKDSYFLNNKILQKQIEEIASKHGLNSSSSNVCGLVSHATQERLMNIVEKLSIFSLHRLETMKDDPTYQPSSDVKSQLRVFEQIDEIERRKREAREREVLIRAAKSRSRQEDPEQARLKEKAKQLQLEEEATLRKRAANKTALDAIGPRKKRRLDELNSAEGSTSTSIHTTLTNTSRNQFPRQRTRHVILKDLLLILEQEKELCHSKLLYKSLMK